MNDFDSFSFHNHSKNSRRLIIFFSFCVILVIFYVSIDLTGSIPAYDYHSIKPSFYQYNQNDSRDSTVHLPSMQEAPKILIWTGFYQDPSWEHSVEKILPCGAYVTRKRAYLSQAKIIIFHWRNTEPRDLPPKRSDQKWIWFHSESPHHTWRSNVMASLQSKFDCWATYRRDSDLYIPYGLVLPKNTDAQTNDLVSVNLASRSKSIAWMVSNCKAPSGRDQYVSELSKHISVDIYGACGKLNCSYFSDFRSKSCWQKMADEYKFYLSFENSICTDYFTEKVINILNYSIIPIVFGGAHYSSVLPSRSFINALDYNSPAELASYLNYLSTNETAYNEYFAWKKDFQVKLLIPESYQDIWCHIFNSLTGPNPVQCQGTSGANLVKWWFGGGQCKRWKPGVGLVSYGDVF